jgi:hypothetical protein
LSAVREHYHYKSTNKSVNCEKFDSAKRGFCITPWNMPKEI